jgi:hypothetical protein
MSDCTKQIIKVHDQYIDFIALEGIDIDICI